MEDQHDAAGSPIDPNTACVACGKQDSPDTMVICDRCQQGFHTGCFGLAAVPEEEEWMCQGCQQLHELTAGQGIVLEMAQTLYSDGPEPHLTQGYYRAQVVSLTAVQEGVCKAQLMVEDCPISDSLRFFSSTSFQRLRRVPRATTQLAAQLYEAASSTPATVLLASSRHGMFGSPAAAAGRSSEAWLSGPDALRQALAALQQPPKQMYLLSRQVVHSQVRHSGNQTQQQLCLRPQHQDDSHVQHRSGTPAAVLEAPAPQAEPKGHPTSAAEQKQAVPAPLAQNATYYPTGPPAAPYQPCNQPQPTTAPTAYSPWHVRPPAEPYHMSNYPGYPPSPWHHNYGYSFPPYGYPTPPGYPPYLYPPPPMYPWGWPPVMPGYANSNPAGACGNPPPAAPWPGFPGHQQQQPATAPAPEVAAAAGTTWQQPMRFAPRGDERGASCLPIARHPAAAAATGGTATRDLRVGISGARRNARKKPRQQIIEEAEMSDTYFANNPLNTPPVPLRAVDFTGISRLLLKAHCSVKGALSRRKKDFSGTLKAPPRCYRHVAHAVDF